MGLDPGAVDGEGVAGCIGRRVHAATRGHPGLGVATSKGGKVGEEADPGAIGVEELCSCAGTVPGLTARYQDH